jgi:lysophospholipase L1-like esterase
MSRFERRAGSTLAIIVIAGFVAALAATEAVLRAIQDPNAARPGVGRVTPARYLEFREWQPGMKFRAAPPQIRRDNPGGRVLDVYAIDTDDDGFIMPSRIHDKPDLTIVFLGGSTTESMYVAPDDRFPYLVGRILERELGIKVNSLNGARSGDNAMHVNAIVLGKVLPLRPDYAVFMTDINDLAVLSRFGTYWNGNSDSALVRQERTGVEWGFRLIRDALIPATYRAYRSALLNARGLLGRKPVAGATSAAPANTEHAQWEQWGVAYASAVQEFVDTTRAWQVRPVLMTEVLLPPGGWRPPGDAAGGDYLAAEKLASRGFSSSSFSDAHEYFNGILRQAARQSNVGLIDLMASGPWTSNEVYDGLHFTDGGSERAARIIADALEAMIKADRAAAGAPIP